MALHVITAFAIWLGASNAAREITKETAIYARERLVNLGVLPYVMSKVSVLSVLCLFQSVALLGIFALRVDLGGLGWDIYPKLIGAIYLTSLAGLSMGLLVSATAGNSDRAMAIVPILVIPQLLLAGALVPLEQMLGPAKVLAQLMMSKWALELTGSMTGLESRFQELATVGLEPWRPAFDIVPWTHWGALAGFVVAMLGATLVAQKRKDVL
jgi:ABC-type multidrug transport system permease subunit